LPWTRILETISGDLDSNKAAVPWRRVAGRDWGGGLERALSEDLASRKSVSIAADPDCEHRLSKHRNAKSSRIRPSSKNRHRVSEGSGQASKPLATRRETSDGLAHDHRFSRAGEGRSFFFFHHLFFAERLHSCVCVPFTPSFKRQNIHKFVF
jgi:hypothetical protein